jgi:hypothetical protein
VGATETTILLAGAAEEAVITSLILGNIDGTNDVTVALHLTKSGGSKTDIVNTLTVGAGEAVEFFIGGKGSMFLENSDKLSATAGVASDLNATISYLLET